VFYIGTNQPDADRNSVVIFWGVYHLPVAGEYMHRDIYDIAERYGKDTFLMIDKLGTDKMPFFFTMKAARRDAGESVAVLPTSPTALCRNWATSSRRIYRSG
jgi:D-lactate dehydrogenase